MGVRYNNALGLHKSDLTPGFNLEITGLQRIHRLPSYYLQVDYSGSDRFSVRTKDNNTVLALTLAHIAQGQTNEAMALLNTYRDTLPASDTGLALALAGDHESAIYVLSEAARAEGASARTRQNLALAFALSGRWAQARILASQDLSLAKVEGRMAEWSKLAEKPGASFQVASLIGTKPQADAGMPVRLALANFPGTQMAVAEAPVQLASADPAPVEAFAPPPPVMDAEAVPAAAPVLAVASNAIRTVELPMPERTADGVVPVTELPQPKPAGDVILADASPYRAAPRVAGEGRIRPALKQAIAMARALVGRPPILIFDEPTSSVDTETEARLMQNLRREFENRTLILITHRPSLLALVDRVILLSQGRVVMDGTPEHINRRVAAVRG